VIDDDNGLRTLVVRVVERAGYAVDSASDGQAGLDRLADRTYDVIVCDLRMPRMDGVSLAPRLRAMPQVTTCLTCQPVMENMARRVVMR
jgi:CheY-like chemotaxis protein